MNMIRGYPDLQLLFVCCLSYIAKVFQKSYILYYFVLFPCASNLQCLCKYTVVSALLQSFLDLHMKLITQLLLWSSKLKYV